MGFRLQKRIRIVKGLTLNLSKSGSSWSVGGKGASINVGGDKVTGNAGIPGTGISYRERLDNPSGQDTSNRPGTGIGRVLFWLLVIAIVGVLFLR